MIRRHVNSNGVVILSGMQGHPLAVDGKLAEHRLVLHSVLGSRRTMRCQWCRTKLAWHGGTENVYVRHLDGDLGNNSPSNLVPACLRCSASHPNRLAEGTQKPVGKPSKRVNRFVPGPDLAALFMRAQSEPAPTRL
jgi:hypothetical protein